MKHTFEAKFGNCNISARQAKVTASPSEENELHVLLFDVESEIKNFFESPSVPKGTVCVKSLVKVPPNCPNCGHELHNMGLGHYELKELDSYNYNGVTATVIPSYNEDILELKLHYETLEYKPCYPKEQN